MPPTPIDTLPLSKRLSYRQARLVVMIAVGLGMLFSFLQIYLDYFSTQKEFDSTINQLLDTIKQPAVQAAYTLDRGLAEKVVQGLFHYQAIYKVELLDDSKEILAKDKKALIETRWRWISELIFGRDKIYQIPLFLPQNSQFGLLKVTVDTHFIAISFLERGLVILMSGLARHLLLAAILLYLFHYIVTKPLFNMAITLASIDPFQPKKNHLPSPPGHDEDELGQLVNSINQLLKFIRKGITERERILQEMETAKQAAEAANEAKTLFLQTITHELLTPMNGVMGMLQLLSYTELTPTQREYLEITQTSGQHLLGLINDVLAISTIEKGEFTLEYERFEIRKVVEEAAESLAKQAYHKQIDLITLVTSEVPQWVKGDRRRFRQIITNLLNNAIKFTEQGEVFIQVSSTLVDDEQVLLYCEVSDTGIGISKEVLPYIFDKFNQGDNSLTRQHEGAGIGLTLCKQLVELMGGNIGVHSELGYGSTFWFSVRLQPTEPEVFSNSTSTSLNGLRILIVDDSVNQRRVLSEYLNYWEVVYDTADTAALALNKLRTAATQNNAFDIVIVDHNLPDLDGTSLSHFIKTDVNLITTHLIILTPLVATPTVTDFEIYLSRPLRQMQLYQAIQQSIQLRLTHYSAVISPLEVWYSRDKQKNILLVEDNTFNQKAALGCFEKLGLQVDIAHNGQEAVSKLARSHYDAIFMDCQMSEQDGYEATRLIRQQEGPDHHTPIIAITANGMTMDRERYLAALIDDYISRPFKLEALRDMIQRWVLSS
jgi:signal transduction histidine kinase/DNA-binding response OmpR family regulator